MKIKIRNGYIELLRGSIVDQDTDAIVNAANNHLWMGSGVAGVIKKMGGQGIETDAVSQGPIEVGDAVITSGGDLKTQYVIHAAGMGQDLKTDSDKVKMSTLSSLKLAEGKELESISFPAIGTGVGGLEVHVCAKTMCNEVIEFLLSAKFLKIVKFVLFDEPTEIAFKEELKKIFSN